MPDHIGNSFLAQNWRTVDKQGQTIDFLLAARRDVGAAKRFFNKTLQMPGNPMPRVINVDCNPAYPTAVKQLKAEGILRKRCKLRQVRYLNNIVEQDRYFPSLPRRSLNSSSDSSGSRSAMVSRARLCATSAAHCSLSLA